MDNRKKKERSAATRMIAMVEKLGITLFHDDQRTGYAAVTVKDHREVWALRSREMANWLRLQFYQQTKRSVQGQAITEVISHLEGVAQFHCTLEKLWLRTAFQDTSLYVDMVNAKWQSIRLWDGDWTIVDRPPVYFRRASGMSPLAEPVRGGDVNILRNYLNLASDGDWLLVLAWITAAFRPYGPYPLLVLSGEQGSAKSSTAALIRSLVDPNSVPIRTEPRNIQDLVIGAENGWITILDNLSTVQSWLSDALCRLSTGGGFSTRKLFTGREEELFNAQRPIITTSIEDITTRGDLLERSLLINLPRIAPEKRRTAEVLQSAFAQDFPQILGALLTLTAKAHKRLRYVVSNELPRMADWARWGVAIERVLGLPAGCFLEAYAANRQMGITVGLESSTLIPALQELVRLNPKWEGTAATLLDSLTGCLNDKNPSRDWPRIPSHLSSRLRRLAPHLPSAGINVDFKIVHGARLICLSSAGRISPTPSTPSTPSDLCIDVPDQWK